MCHTTVNTTDLAIYGAGGLGREIVALINAINQSFDEPIYNLIGFFDDGKEIGSPVSHFGKVLGGIDQLNAWDKPLAVALAFGSPHTISIIHSKITNPLIMFPNLIHPSFWIGDPETFTIGQGNIIQRNCVVTTEVSIGDFNLLNAFDMIGHDSKVGSFNVFMPEVNISGEVSIGNHNLFGAKSFVLQGIKIGDKVTLGAGGILLTKPKDGCSYLGNPARKLL